MSSQVEERVQVEIVDGDVRLNTPDRNLELSAIWLRDSSTDDESRDPVSGQRLFNIVDLPENVRVDDARIVDGALELTFGPDGHRTTFDLATLLDDRTQPLTDARNESKKDLWLRASDLGSIPKTAWQDYLRDRAPVLRRVVDQGFALLGDVPAELEQVIKVSESFGYVRDTNYGRLFDVRIEENATNLAFTPLPISPHTDNPYRDPVPTMQLLHCLSNAADGGESGLVDGFAAAAALRERDPRAFETLTTVKVGYRFDTAETHLHSATPLIEVDAGGAVRCIRFNNRSMIVPALEPAQMRAFYDAYRTFAELVYAPEAQLNFRMDSGDCLIFDNTRLLHARTAFGALGGRHLQGTYADLDGLLSTLYGLENP